MITLLYLADSSSSVKKTCGGICRLKVLSRFALHDKWNLCMITAMQPRDTLAPHGSVLNPQGLIVEVSPGWSVHNRHIPLSGRDDRKSPWSRQHGCLSSSWQSVQYSKYGTPAVRRAAESQEEAFHLIGSKTEPWTTVEHQPHIFPKQKTNKRRDICFHIKHLTYWKKNMRIKKLSTRTMTSAVTDPFYYSGYAGKLASFAKR